MRALNRHRGVIQVYSRPKRFRYETATAAQITVSLSLRPNEAASYPDFQQPNNPIPGLSVLSTFKKIVHWRS